MTFPRARAKIHRANQHISDLNVQARSFTDSNPYSISFEKNPDNTGNLSVVLHVRQGASADLTNLSLVTGDAIHNLRSALDLLAVELVEAAKANAENVYFPFAADANGLQVMIKQRHIDRAGPKVVDIIQSLKPYHGGNYPLRAIHDLDIADKHRSLIAFKSGGPLKGDAPDPEVKARLGVEGFKPEPGKKYHFATTVHFGDGLPFAAEPIVPTLHNLAEIANGVIDAFVGV